MPPVSQNAAEGFDGRKITWTDAKGVVSFARSCHRGGYNGLDWKQWGLQPEGAPTQYTVKLGQVLPHSPQARIGVPSKPGRRPLPTSELNPHLSADFTSSHRRAPAVRIPTVGRDLLGNSPSAKEQREAGGGVRLPPAPGAEGAAAAVAAADTVAGTAAAGALRSSLRPSNLVNFSLATSRATTRITWMPAPGGGTVDEYGAGAYLEVAAKMPPLRNAPSRAPATSSPRPGKGQRRAGGGKVQSAAARLVLLRNVRGGRSRIPAYMSNLELVNKPQGMKAVTAAFDYEVERGRAVVEKGLHGGDAAFKAAPRRMLASTGIPALGRAAGLVHDSEALTKLWVRRNIRRLQEEEEQQKAEGRPPPCSVAEMVRFAGSGSCGGDGGGGFVGAGGEMPPIKAKNVATPSMYLTCSREDDVHNIVTHPSREKVARRIRALETCPQHFIREEARVSLADVLDLPCG